MFYSSYNKNQSSIQSRSHHVVSSEATFLSVFVLLSEELVYWSFHLLLFVEALENIGSKTWIGTSYNPKKLGLDYMLAEVTFLVVLWSYGTISFYSLRQRNRLLKLQSSFGSDPWIIASCNLSARFKLHAGWEGLMA